MKKGKDSRNENIPGKNRAASHPITGAVHHGLSGAEGLVETAALWSFLHSTTGPATDENFLLQCHDAPRMDEERYADAAIIKGDVISAEDMTLLNQAGYHELELDSMDTEELRAALEEAGVDSDFYDFDEF